MKNIFVVLGVVFSFLFPFRFFELLRSSYKYVYTGFLKCQFASFGRNSVINPTLLYIRGAGYIHVGNDVYIGSRVQLTAWDNVNGDTFSPSIFIGDNSSIGDESHISAINKIIIGSGVLTGKRVLITDNSHGGFTWDDECLIPVKRKMKSKGPVIIGDNVWIGEKATILPGVTIGDGSIIGANSVVTKNIPSYSLVVGSPAKVIDFLS